jgi:hypothetical protein
MAHIHTDDGDKAGLFAMLFLTQLLLGYQKILVTHTVTSKPSGM